MSDDAGAANSSSESAVVSIETAAPPVMETAPISPVPSSAPAPEANMAHSQPENALPAESASEAAEVVPPIVVESQQPPPPSPQATVPTSGFFGRDILAKARELMQFRKRKKLNKILELLSSKGKITNNQVESLLHCSDATATRYLSILEKEGKIKQMGKTGKAVTYTKS